MNKPEFLLDANVLIALYHPSHLHHASARQWLGADISFAVCPITEGALVRYTLQKMLTAAPAVIALKRLSKLPNYHWIPDDLTYLEAGVEKLQGHKQVTDVYLAALAEKHGMRLATFDKRLNRMRPDATFLVPTE